MTRRALSHVGACGTGTAGAYNGCWVGTCLRVLACSKHVARAGDGIEFALSWPQVAAVPSIYIKVIKAEGIRQHKRRFPTPSMLIRVSVAGQAQPEVVKTKPMPAGSDPLWCDFALPYFTYHLQATIPAVNCCRVLAGGARGKLKRLQWVLTNRLMRPERCALPCLREISGTKNSRCLSPTQLPLSWNAQSGTRKTSRLIRLRASNLLGGCSIKAGN